MRLPALLACLAVPSAGLVALQQARVAGHGGSALAPPKPSARSPPVLRCAPAPAQQQRSSSGRASSGRHSRACEARMSAWSEMVRTSSPRLRHTATTLAPALGTLALGSALLVFYPQQRLVLTRLALRLYRAYGAAAMGSPLLTKAATSGVAYCLGDMLAQRFSADGGREPVAGESAGGGLVGASATSAVPFFLDAPRATRSAIAGFFSHGPQLHYWCLLLERYVSFGGAWYALLVKIALDQVAFLKKKQKKRKKGTTRQDRPRSGCVLSLTHLFHIPHLPFFLYITQIYSRGAFSLSLSTHLPPHATLPISPNT